jgi:phage tail-like protein
MLQEDEFAQQLCAGLDDVLAPVLSTLDCLDAYFDPKLTPPDFLDWLADWVGAAVDDNWVEPKRRQLVGQAGELYRWQGTMQGIANYVELYIGTPVEVEDNGGISWSRTPEGPLPGGDQPELVVRVRTADPGVVNHVHVDAIVAAIKPANVPHRVEVVSP